MHINKYFYCNLQFTEADDKPAKNFCVFRGEIIVNFTAEYEVSSTVRQIIEDETTPNAVLLASTYSILRMYLNGSTEDVVGQTGSAGYVIGVCDIIIDINNFKLL